LDRSHREVLQVFQTAALRKAEFWVLLDSVTPVQLEMHFEPGTCPAIRLEVPAISRSLKHRRHRTSFHPMFCSKTDDLYIPISPMVSSPSKTGIQKGYQVDPQIRPQEFRRDAVVVETDGMPKDRMSRGLRPAREAIFQLSHRT
jgi:hypothetical protein